MHTRIKAPRRWRMFVKWLFGHRFHTMGYTVAVHFGTRGGGKRGRGVVGLASPHHSTSKQSVSNKDLRSALLCHYKNQPIKDLGSALLCFYLESAMKVALKKTDRKTHTQSTRSHFLHWDWLLITHIVHEYDDQSASIRFTSEMRFKASLNGFASRHSRVNGLIKQVYNHSDWQEFTLSCLLIIPSYQSIIVSVSVSSFLLNNELSYPYPYPHSFWPIIHCIRIQIHILPPHGPQYPYPHSCSPPHHLQTPHAKAPFKTISAGPGGGRSLTSLLSHFCFHHINPSIH